MCKGMQGSSQILLKTYNHNDSFLEEGKSEILSGVRGSSREGGIGPWSFQRIAYHGFLWLNDHLHFVLRLMVK